MKKKLAFIALLGILYGIYCLFSWNGRRMVRLKVQGDGFQVSVKADSRQQTVLPWEREDGVVCFFLPSCTDNRVYADQAGETILIDGKTVNSWNGFVWEPGTIYTIEAGDARQQVLFMKSENLPAIFLSTESGSMEWIHADKDNQEPGEIRVLGENGSIQYAGGLEAVSGRGNSTWKEEKKPYSITLRDSSPLCGMSAGKTWKLLALYYEHDKIHSKLTYDMARELGLNTTPACAWADLYCNGEYQGLYLLTESKKRNLPEDVEWLLEKTHNSRLSGEEEEQSFTTEMGYLFQTEKIGGGVQAEVSEAAAYTQHIEDLLALHDPAYKEYLDLDSLARKFLLEKIVMNYDAMGCSAYFMLKKDGKLYAGPAWDYDNTFGTSGFFDYTSPIEGLPDEMTGWFNVLYEDEEFRSCMVEAYRDLLPYLTTVLEEKIDASAAWVGASASMDLARWGMASNKMFLYQEYDSYVRYLKYFLAGRLNYLNELWGIEGVEFEEPRPTEELHRVSFQTEDGELLEERQVKDGTRMKDLPALNEEIYRGWFFPGIDKRYESYFPVYGDMTLCAREREEDS